MLRATRACSFSTSQLPKVVRSWCVLYILTWKRASRHNGVHFFDISTSKSAPDARCFCLFHFDMCFVPQRHALFPLLNCQKWQDLRRFYHVDFKICFAPQQRAILDLPSDQVTRWLRTRSFSELIFRPSGATKHWKNHVSRPL